MFQRVKGLYAAWQNDFSASFTTSFQTEVLSLPFKMRTGGKNFDEKSRTEKMLDCGSTTCRVMTCNNHEGPRVSRRKPASLARVELG